MSHHTPVAGNVMQPIAFSVVQNIKVGQDYRKDDDHCIPADIVVVDTAVLFTEVLDLESLVAVVLVAPILHLLHHISLFPLDTGTVAEEVAEVGVCCLETGVPSWVGSPQDIAEVNGLVDCGNGGIDGGVHDGMGTGAETAPPEALVLPN
ncbi:hypothetical protein L2E82_35586 [Cichorium intybus]|uniref:Uncharacterized protein n=1 Tax=Cichorium intybus TaxID=13427 RepID=A0ACB9BP56_CICIN|nr:hypothetical protein L2E82_35586 [Cichorium intybus]